MFRLPVLPSGNCGLERDLTTFEPGNCGLPPHATPPTPTTGPHPEHGALGTSTADSSACCRVGLLKVHLRISEGTRRTTFCRDLPGNHATPTRDTVFALDQMRSLLSHSARNLNRQGVRRNFGIQGMRPRAAPVADDSTVTHLLPALLAAHYRDHRIEQRGQCPSTGGERLSPFFGASAA